MQSIDLLAHRLLTFGVSLTLHQNMLASLSAIPMLILAIISMDQELSLILIMIMFPICAGIFMTIRMVICLDKDWLHTMKSVSIWLKQRLKDGMSAAVLTNGIRKALILPLIFGKYRIISRT